METLDSTTSVGLIACCECGLPIQPNSANMCSGCLRSKIDITEGISRTCTIYICKFCQRYFVPPNGWMRAELESKELLSICLKKMKPSLMKVRLTDACFVWTEAHSKRIKVKMTVQKEVFSSTILQQTFVVEFTVHNQMCDDCRRSEAKDFWRACVQAHSQCTGVKPVPTGIDFFFAKLQEARKLVDFLLMVLPCKYHYAQRKAGHGFVSKKHGLADVWLVRSNQVGSIFEN
uniref:60S ribosomal export protein NMD3 n=1 Tax=Heterorhabditis bacteriophora TaxID=37862 RepID=A0A1I7WTE2_HETBA